MVNYFYEPLKLTEKLKLLGLCEKSCVKPNGHKEDPLKHPHTTYTDMYICNFFVGLISLSNSLDKCSSMFYRKKTIPENTTKIKTERRLNNGIFYLIKHLPYYPLPSKGAKGKKEALMMNN